MRADGEDADEHVVTSWFVEAMDVHAASLSGGEFVDDEVHGRRFA